MLKPLVSFLTLSIACAALPGLAQSPGAATESAAAQPSQSSSISGLSLAKGPRLPGMPFTSQVQAIASGSAAALADLQIGDVIVQIGTVGGDWSNHHSFIDQGLQEHDTATLVIVRDNRRMQIVLTALPDDVAAPALRTRPEQAANAAELLARGHFAHGDSALDQLAQLAAAVGVPEEEVTRAMVTGAFNPHLADVVAAFEELPGLTCGELLEKELARHARGNVTEDEIQNQKTFLSMNMNSLCPGWMRRADSQRIDAWNARFGVVDTNEMPPGIARLADFQGPAPASTVVAFFMRNPRSQEAYAQNRCNFTSALAQHLPSMSIHIDCPNGMRPAIQTDMGLAQLAAARRDDVFGPANGVFALRLRLMHDGGFEGLQTLIRQDARLSAQSVIPFRVFSGARDQIEQQAIDSGYVGLIALYAMLRLDRLGACGDDLTKLTQRTEFWTEYRNGLGQYLGEGARDTISRDFTVLSKFAPAVTRAQVTDRIGSDVLGEIAGLFDELTCDDPRRIQLEANMHAYLAGRPPSALSAP